MALTDRICRAFANVDCAFPLDAVVAVGTVCEIVLLIAKSESWYVGRCVRVFYWLSVVVMLMFFRRLHRVPELQIWLLQ